MIDLLDKYLVISFVILGLIFIVVTCLKHKCNGVYKDPHETMYDGGEDD